MWLKTFSTVPCHQGWCICSCFCRQIAAGAITPPCSCVNWGGETSVPFVAQELFPFFHQVHEIFRSEVPNLPAWLVDEWFDWLSWGLLSECSRFMLSLYFIHFTLFTYCQEQLLRASGLDRYQVNIDVLLLRSWQTCQGDSISNFESCWNQAR